VPILQDLAHRAYAWQCLLDTDTREEQTEGEMRSKRRVMRGKVGTVPMLVAVIAGYGVIKICLN
jgi:hypothetical protein